MSDEFTDILNMSLEEIKGPEPLPAGTYLGLVEGQPAHREVNGKDGERYNVVDFNLRLLEVIQAEDEQMAKAILSDGRRIRHGIFVRPKDANNSPIRKFLVNDLGISKSVKLGEAINEAMGKEVIVHINQKPSSDGSTMFNNVVGTAKKESIPY